MLTVYGKQLSRTARCLWLLEEMGLTYRQVPVNTQNGENRRPEFLKLNPSAKVPVIDDQGFVLRESLAINFYLVAKAATPLWPASVQTQAYIHQWSSWSVSELEVPLNVIFRAKRRAGATGTEADPALIADNIEIASKTLQLLEDHLSSHAHMAHDSFTLGDINTYTAAMLAPMFVDMSDFPSIGEWMTRCSARPAWQRVTALP